MINLFFIAFFAIIFFAITWRRFEWGIFLFFLLLPTYLIRFHVGPIPSTLLEVMILILTIVFTIKKISRNSLSSLFQEKKEFLKKNKFLNLGIFLFLLGATISIFTAVDGLAAAGEWRAFYIEPILIFFVLTHFFKTLELTKHKQYIEQYIVFPLLLCGLTTSILAIVQHFTGWLVPYAFWENRATYRVTGWYGFPNAVGLFLAPLFPLAIWMIMHYWREKKLKNVCNIVSLLFLLTSPLAIFFAKGSGPVIGLLAGIGILFLYYKKTRMITLVAAIITVVGIIFLPANHPIKQEIFAQNYSGKIRRDIWSETFALLKDRPVLGAGIASYEERIVPYRADHWIEVFHHPHNIFLTIWVNTGIVGLLGFLFILTWIFLTSLKKFPFIVSALTILLVMGLVDSPYIKNDLAILFWLLPTIIFSEKNVQEKTA